MEEKMKYYAKLADEFLNSDISLTKMAEREFTTRQTLAKYFKKLGVEIVNKQNTTKFNENIFDSIDTEEKAYWLGFIYADGTISSHKEGEKPKNTLEVSLKGNDIEHLKKFSIFLNSKKETKLSKSKCANKEYIRCRFSVSNKHLWETLNNYGCTPKKSLILTFPDENIFKDKSLIRHFIRGYFDGDGCISRNISTYIVSPKISIIGTKSFLENIIKYSNIKCKFKHDKRHTEFTYELEYHKEDGIQFINYLYNNASVFLDRKYKLYEFFKNGSRSVEEFTELSQTNIGESPEMDNTEISIETKESIPSYSVETEPTNVE